MFHVKHPRHSSTLAADPFSSLEPVVGGFLDSFVMVVWRWSERYQAQALTRIASLVMSDPLLRAGPHMFHVKHETFCLPIASFHKDHDD